VELSKKIESLLQRGEKKRAQLGISLREIVDRDHNVEHLMDRLVEVFDNRPEKI